MSRTLNAPSRSMPNPLLTPGTWVEELIGATVSLDPLKARASILENENAALITVKVTGARAMNGAQFEQSVQDAYHDICSALASTKHSQPVRFWNYLPAIHEPMDSVRDRYMVFNAGRFAALNDWFDGPSQLPERLPAASGVGHDGDDLVIHCLGFAEPGKAVENPRQIPAFRYSARYGPRPPCFARATIAQDPRDKNLLLLVAGTASIRGEQTIHPADLHAQLEETTTNLRALLSAATAPAKENDLNAFVDLRVYYLRDEDAPAIAQFIQATFGPATRVEMCRADICRADLLVEIEGVARLNADTKD